MKAIISTGARASAFIGLGLTAGALTLQTAHGADATDPVEIEVFAGAAFEDNLFRLEGESEGLSTIGTDDLEDWYRYVGAGFRGNFAGAERRFEIDADIFRQTFDEFDFLDYTGGHLAATGEWALASNTDGTLGYQYQRRLQSFTNKAATTRDIIQEHGFSAGIERTLAQRWQLRALGGWSDLNFSNSDFLDKQVLEGEAEIRYAASQRSIFGLLATATQSDFDSNDDRDFSGWSVGPSFEWQITTRFQLTANFGYTHRSLDESGEVEDYDGVTGFVAARWSPRDTFTNELRVFRDVSNLGGEVSEYTERTGLRWQPSWQMTPKLRGRFSLAYEERDFNTTSEELDRTDDFVLAELWLDYEPTQRLLLTLGYAYENKDSTLATQDFDANVLKGEIRFRF